MHTKVSTEVRIRSIDSLVFYARNPRKNDAAVDRMCASIREFGFKIPCLIRSDGEVIDGHLRLKAARRLGITEIPVILCDEWTPEHALQEMRAFHFNEFWHPNMRTWVEKFPERLAKSPELAPYRNVEKRDEKVVGSRSSGER